VELDLPKVKDPGLLVGTWPPRRCGIASYNAQLAAEEGWTAFDAAPETPVAFRLLSFLRAVRGKSVVRISFDPYALACGSIQALWLYPILLIIGARKFEIVVHEPWKSRAYRSWIANWMYVRFCRNAQWLLLAPSQGTSLMEAFGPGLRTRSIPHGAHFRPSFEGSREDARKDLGLDGGRVWLCIGFISAAKGFSRFVTEFVRLGGEGMVWVVGSVRTAITSDEQEARILRELSQEHPAAVSFHEEFVDDEQFDRWIQASDVVVLPYLETSTSGVVERARLYGKVVLARDLPGLRDVLVDDPRSVLYMDDTFAQGLGKAGALLESAR